MKKRNQPGHDEVLNLIIQAMESDTKIWRPSQLVGGRPFNAITQRYYHGMNCVSLWIAGNTKKYNCDAWLTFKQVMDLGGKVKKGEKAKTVYYFTIVEKQAEEAANDSADTHIKFPYTKCFNVFNLRQTEGIEDKVIKPQKLNVDVDKLINSINADVRHSDTRSVACYNRVSDYIELPDRRLFLSNESYYATLLHELVHWTGHQSRLGRFKSGGSWSKEDYAFEELVAELGASFLSADLGVKEEVVNHASYLKEWAEMLKEQSSAIFKAASLAEKAVQYLYDLASQNSDGQLGLFQLAA